jgi:3-hydroxyacyl-CoA dehydrogenase/enoyl-CoA hydratase/3-hydroxybutyryl-CoA epimerase
VKQRLLHRQALETARCIEEGVLKHAADGDIGSIFGIGFPAWTGGALSYIDTIGIRRFVEDCDELAVKHGERFAVSDWLRARAAAGETFYPAPKAAA